MREYGHDTLAFFKLREDKHYLFNPERTAFLGYRVESGVLVISGDPVGARQAVESLIPATVRFAEQRALRLAALGVSTEGRALFEQAGLRALYIGDEAIVETERFNLEGRAIRKVRQSVSRLRNAGYTAPIPELGSLDDATLTNSKRSLGTRSRAPRNAASAWPWTRCATQRAVRRSSCIRETGTGRSAASSSSCRATGEAPSPSPPCAASQARPTG